MFHRTKWHGRWIASAPQQKKKKKRERTGLPVSLHQVAHGRKKKTIAVPFAWSLGLISFKNHPPAIVSSQEMDHNGRPLLLLPMQRPTGQTAESEINMTTMCKGWNRIMYSGQKKAICGWSRSTHKKIKQPELYFIQFTAFSVMYFYKFSTSDLFAGAVYCTWYLRLMLAWGHFLILQVWLQYVTER